MTPSPSLHVFILCWPGKEENARHISRAVEGHADRLTVLYKCDGEDLAEKGAGEWRRIDSAWYYGRQFKESLALNAGDVMMHIQADAACGNWPEVVARCRGAFAAVPEAGVWSPNVYHSWYTPELTQIHELDRRGLAAVTVTDGVVWALSSRMTERMRTLSYESNNIGWGLTEVAASIAATSDMLVVMDVDLKVRHPRGSGYDRDEALRQATVFSSQLSPAQRAYIDLLLIAARLRDLPSKWTIRGLAARLRRRFLDRATRC
jgi:hypothetical protein